MSAAPPGALVALVCFLITLLLLSIAAETRGVPASAACISLGAVVGVLLGPTGVATAWGVDASLDVFNRDLYRRTASNPGLYISQRFGKTSVRVFVVAASTTCSCRP